MLVTIEYRVEKPNCAAFLGAIDEMGRERKRDGAFAWGVFEDAAAKRPLPRDVPDRILAGNAIFARARDQRRPNAGGRESRQLLAESPKVTFLTASARTRRSGRKHRLELPSPDDAFDLADGIKRLRPSSRVRSARDAGQFESGGDTSLRAC